MKNERDIQTSQKKKQTQAAWRRKNETLHPSKQDVLKWQKKHLESAKKKRQTWRLK